eukprot:128289_1
MVAAERAIEGAFPPTRKERRREGAGAEIPQAAEAENEEPKEEARPFIRETLLVEDRNQDAQAEGRGRAQEEGPRKKGGRKEEGRPPCKAKLRWGVLALIGKPRGRRRSKKFVLDAVVLGNGNGPVHLPASVGMCRQKMHTFVWVLAVSLAFVISKTDFFGT